MEGRAGGGSGHGKRSPSGVAAVRVVSGDGLGVEEVGWGGERVWSLRQAALGRPLQRLPRVKGGCVPSEV